MHLGYIFMQEIVGKFIIKANWSAAHWYSPKSKMHGDAFKCDEIQRL